LLFSLFPQIFSKGDKKGRFKFLKWKVLGEERAGGIHE
jgi:hypothetical protein